MPLEKWSFDDVVKVSKSQGGKHGTGDSDKATGPKEVKGSSSDTHFEDLMETKPTKSKEAKASSAGSRKSAADKADKAMEELLNTADKAPPKLMSDEMLDKLNKWATHSNEYFVDPRVKDEFLVVPKTASNLTRADRRLKEGRALFGSEGFKLRSLFMGRRTPKQQRGLTKGKTLDAPTLFKTKCTKPGTPPAVWKRDLEGRIKSTAVSILMDHSGSMGDGEYNGSKAAVSEAILLGLGELLDQMRIPWESLGFTGVAHSSVGGCSANTRDEPMTFHLIKTFEESRTVPYKAMWPQNTGHNCDYDALRIALPRLMARREEVKILFHIGDGHICTGNSTWDRLSTIGYKKDVAAARAKGVYLFGFGIDEDLSYLFGREASVLVDPRQPKAFAAEFVKKLTKLILGG